MPGNLNQSSIHKLDSRLGSSFLPTESILRIEVAGGVGMGIRTEFGPLRPLKGLAFAVFWAYQTPALPLSPLLVGHQHPGVSLTYLQQTP
jgi:hypothetical protein